MAIVSKWIIDLDYIKHMTSFKYSFDIYEYIQVTNIFIEENGNAIGIN